ncbi:MAG: VOC family protein [Rhodothalassiaceae bacterium]
MTDRRSFVTAIGGAFFRARDASAMQDWYREMLGLDIDAGFGGTVFRWPTADRAEPEGMTVWAPFAADSRYFHPGTADFMINHRVSDLDALIAHLTAGGVPLAGEIEEHPYGRFAWVLDPEGRKIELWEPGAAPPDSETP